MTWWKTSAALAALALLVLAAGAGVAAATGVGMAEMVRDPATADERAWYTGLVSVVGVMAWAGTSAACFAVGCARVRERGALFLLGALTAVLALDDAFLLHEDVLPELGLPEPAPMLGYALAAVAVLALLRRSAPRDVQLPVVVAGALLAASIGLDRAVPGLALVVLEDALKLLGAFQLLAVPALVAARLVPAAVASAAGGPAAPAPSVQQVAGRRRAA